MDETELFNETLKYFAEYYNLNVEKDGRIIHIKLQNGEELGCMNSVGYCYLYNLSVLVDILKDKLL